MEHEVLQLIKRLGESPCPYCGERHTAEIKPVMTGSKSSAEACMKLPDGSSVTIGFPSGACSRYRRAISSMVVFPEGLTIIKSIAAFDGREGVVELNVEFTYTFKVYHLKASDFNFCHSWMFIN